MNINYEALKCRWFKSAQTLSLLRVRARDWMSFAPLFWQRSLLLFSLEVWRRSAQPPPPPPLPPYILFPLLVARAVSFSFPSAPSGILKEVRWMSRPSRGDPPLFRSVSVHPYPSLAIPWNHISDLVILPARAVILLADGRRAGNKKSGRFDQKSGRGKRKDLQ